MEIPTPTTELEAVNFLLEAIEEEGVNTLVDVTDPDVSAAQLFLKQSLLSLQAPGWVFNTEPTYKLNPDLTGGITVPGNLTKFTVAGRRLAIRGGRLFDRDDQTYQFPEEVEGEAILMLGFEELPLTARNYVVLQAAFRFQARRAADELTARLTNQEVEDAWTDFVSEDTEDGNYSFSHIADIQNRAR